MVVLKRINKQNINEAKQVGTLYHVCTLDALVNYIIPNNELKASGKYWNDLLDTDQQVCFTRDPLFVVPTWTVSGGNILFQFVVDGDKLSERYKVTPFNFSDSPNQRYREKEEDVIGPISNFKSYVKEVRFDIKDLDVVSSNINNIINDLENVKKYLGSIKCYRSELPFLDKHWNINFGKVKDPKYKIKTIDDFITILKSYIGSNVSKIRIDTIDTPDLFAKYLDSLNTTQIKNILDEHPKWIKYININRACERNKYELIEVLIENGVSVNVKDEDGRTPLIIACDYDNSKLAKLLIENGANVNAKNKNETTPLILVCYHNNYDLVKLLIDNGAGINVKDSYGNTPLSIAYEKCDSKIVKLLVENGADVNVKDRFGSSLLASACRKKDFKIVKLLVENGADVNTAIDTAFTIKNDDLIKYFFENGADVNFKNRYDGGTPLLYACKINDFELAKFLINKGADINVKDKHGYSPLLLACYKDNSKLVKLLVENGADIDIRDNEGNTPLIIACGFDNSNLVKLFIEKGADVNAMSRVYTTPLLNACQCNSLELVRLLVENGADLDDEETILEKAEDSSEEIYEYLKSVMEK